MRTLPELARARPFALGLAVGLVYLLAQTAVDAALGATAEYFNAWHLMRALGAWLGGAGGEGPAFLMHQERLGGFALPVGLALLGVQPLLVATGVVALLRRLG